MENLITIAQITSSLNKNNLEKHITVIKEAKKKNSLSKLIVFPELSLNGYNLQDAVSEDFFTLDELKIFTNMSQDFKIDIVVGAILKEKLEYFNSVIYFSDGEIKNIHKKVNLPNYGMFEEKRFFTPNSDIIKFQSFNTVNFGKIMTVICEDLWNAETIAEIQNQKLDLLIVASNSPTRGFESENLEIKSKWESILKATAILGKTTVVFSNRVGFEDGLGFWGGSMIIDSNSKIVKQLPLFEEKIN
jgi:predicted amidohydrolase